MLTVNAEATPTDVNYMILYKVAKKHNLLLPAQGVHVYLAGTIERVNNPSNQETFSRFVVNSVDDLEKVVEKNQTSPEPNALPYLVGKFSGDFFINFNAQSHEKDALFPAICYSFAQFHGGRMGRKESQILGLIALDPERYLNLLISYYGFLRENPYIEITDEDYQAFKKEFKGLKNSLAAPSKVKQKTSKNLLI